MPSRTHTIHLNTGDVSALSVAAGNDATVVLALEVRADGRKLVLELTERERLALADLLTRDQPRVVLVAQACFRQPRRRRIAL